MCVNGFSKYSIVAPHYIGLIAVLRLCCMSVIVMENGWKVGVSEEKFPFNCYDFNGQ